VRISRRACAITALACLTGTIVSLGIFHFMEMDRRARLWEAHRRSMANRPPVNPTDAAPAINLYHSDIPKIQEIVGDVAIYLLVATLVFGIAAFLKKSK
jgi:hypothetical protein